MLLSTSFTFSSFVLFDFFLSYWVFAVANGFWQLAHTYVSAGSIASCPFGDMGAGIRLSWNNLMYTTDPQSHLHDSRSSGFMLIAFFCGIPILGIVCPLRKFLLLFTISPFLLLFALLCRCCKLVMFVH